MTRLRRDLCLLRAGGTPGAAGLRRFAERLAMRVRIWAAVGGRQALRLIDGIGEYAARVVFARHGAEEAIKLLDVLFEVGESESAALADPVDRAPQAQVPAAVSELAGDAPAAQCEDGRQRRHHHREAHHLRRRYPRDRDEEHVQNDRAEDGDPERETKRAENAHQLVKVA